MGPAGRTSLPRTPQNASMDLNDSKAEEDRTESSNYLWIDRPWDALPNWAMSFGCFLPCSQLYILRLVLFYFIFKDLLVNELLCNRWKTILQFEHKEPPE